MPAPGRRNQFQEIPEAPAAGLLIHTRQIKDLNNTAKLVQAEINDNDDEEFVRFLSVLATYRQHQKFFRFAHLVFNRISILHGEELMRLSSQAGTLYQLPTADEVTEGENRIVHHAILKADVRGLTTVTDELEKRISTRRPISACVSLARSTRSSLQAML